MILFNFCMLYEVQSAANTIAFWMFSDNLLHDVYAKKQLTTVSRSRSY